MFAAFFVTHLRLFGRKSADHYQTDIYCRKAFEIDAL
jgi:hypothetical protein